MATQTMPYNPAWGPIESDRARSRIGENIWQSWQIAPTLKILNQFGRRRSPYLPGTSLDQQEFNSTMFPKLGITYQPGMSFDGYLDILHARREAATAADVQERSTTAGAIAGVVSGIVTGLIDPTTPIPLGGGAAAVGRSILTTAAREAAVNAAVNVPFLIADYNLARQAGMAGSPQEYMSEGGLINLGIAAAVGAIAGGAGRYIEGRKVQKIERLAERAQGADLGVVEHEGRVMTNDEFIREVVEQPQVVPEPQVNTPETGQVEPTPGTGRFEEGYTGTNINRSTKAKYTQEYLDGLDDKGLLDLYQSEVTDRRLEVRRTADGKRYVYDADLQAEAAPPFYKTTEELSTTMKRIERQISGERSPAARANTLRRILEQRARTSVREQRLDKNANPLVPFLLKNKKKVSRKTVWKWFDQNLLRSEGLRDGRVVHEKIADAETGFTDVGKGTYTGTKRTLITKGTKFHDGWIRNNLAQLDRQTFDFLFDWVANDDHLRFMMKEVGASIDKAATKRELIDDLWDAVHGANKPEPVKPAPKARPKPVQEIAKEQQKVETQEGVKRVQAAQKAGVDPVDAAKGIDQVNARNLRRYLEHKIGAKLEDIDTRGDPALRQYVQDIQDLEKKRTALWDALACIGKSS